MMISTVGKIDEAGAAPGHWQITDQDRGQISLLNHGRYPSLVAAYDETDDGLPYVFLQDQDETVSFSIVPDTRNGYGWSLLNAKGDITLVASSIRDAVILLLQGSSHASLPPKQEGKLVLRSN